MKSPNNIDVPFEILFQINHLVQLGTLSGPTLDNNFFRLVSPKFVPADHIKRALYNMRGLKNTCLNTTDWLSATTGISSFAECQVHSAKPQKHPAKALPSVALGEAHSANKSSAKTSLPSVFYRTLGENFAECYI